MPEFHRMITYLHLYEHGTKGRNIGYSKIEKRGGQCLVEIHMKNTGYSLSPIPVYFYVKKQQKFLGIPLGSLSLHRGNGDFKARLDTGNLAGCGYDLSDVKGIYLPLSEQVMFVSQWDNDEFVREHFQEAPQSSALDDPAEQSLIGNDANTSQDMAVPQDHAPSAEQQQSVPSSNTIMEQDMSAAMPSPQQDGSLSSNVITQDTLSNPSAEQQNVPNQNPGASPDTIPAPPDTPVSNEPEKTSHLPDNITAAEAAPNRFRNNRRNVSLFPRMATPQKKEPVLEDWNLKWKLIMEKYPVMTPFAGDEDTLCVRLELKDLRELPKKYWYFGNNSFLLHGFFNYRHLILGVQEKSGNKKWFLGIPGIFQNPERVMASLFGFPEFRNTKSSPTNTGEFGYWYRYLDEASTP